MRRPHLKGELRERVYEHIISWVSTHPNRRIPAQHIADKYGITPQQVGHATGRLVLQGRLERLSWQTYAVTKKVRQLPLPEVNAPIQPKVVPVVGDIEKLAKDYVWYQGNDSLKGFVEWLKNL